MSSTLSPSSLATGTWSVDPVHSSIGFAVKHLGVSTFRGTFAGVSGTIVTEGGAVSRVEGVVEVASITTPDDNLTGHLASPDFFDAATYPQARFTSTRVDDLGEGRLHVAGELSIRGVTQPVELEAELEGAGFDPYGNERLGIAGSGTIDRTAFGISWNAPLANGALAVAEKVKLTLHVEAVRQAA